MHHCIFRRMEPRDDNVTHRCRHACTLHDDLAELDIKRTAVAVDCRPNRKVIAEYPQFYACASSIRLDCFQHGHFSGAEGWRNSLPRGEHWDEVLFDELAELCLRRRISSIQKKHRERHVSTHDCESSKVDDHSIFASLHIVPAKAVIHGLCAEQVMGQSKLLHKLVDRLVFDKRLTRSNPNVPIHTLIRVPVIKLGWGDAIEKHISEHLIAFADHDAHALVDVEVVEERRDLHVHILLAEAMNEECFHQIAVCVVFGDVGIVIVGNHSMKQLDTRYAEIYK